MAQADVDVPPAPAAAAAVDTDPNKSLERLYDYTKFHIGAYLTLTASYLTAVGLNLSGCRCRGPWPGWPCCASWSRVSPAA